MFSSIVLDYFQNPRNHGVLEGADAIGEAGSLREGRFIQIAVKLHQGRIQAARFKTYGCVPAIASASCISEWVEGRTVDEARAFTIEQLVELLGGLPHTRRFCAVMAIAALRDGLDKAQKGTCPC